MKPQNLSEALRAVLHANPKAPEADVRKKCWEKVRKNPELMKSVFDYWFNNSFRDFRVTPKTPVSATVIAVQKKRKTEVLEKVTAKLRGYLMDHALSDGTLLRYATFGQVGREGGWLSEVAKLGKPQEVIGKKLTECEISNIRQQHYKTIRKVAA